MQDNLTDAAEVLVERGYINRDKMCIAGISYGG